MRRKARGATASYREFEIHSGRRTVTTTYSSSALQAAIDHLRALGRAATRSGFSGPTRSHGGERGSSLFPFSRHIATSTSGPIPTC